MEKVTENERAYLNALRRSRSFEILSRICRPKPQSFGITGDRAWQLRTHRLAVPDVKEGRDAASRS